MVEKRQAYEQPVGCLFHFDLWIFKFLFLKFYNSNLVSSSEASQVVDIFVQGDLFAANLDGDDASTETLF